MSGHTLTAAAHRSSTVREAQFDGSDPPAAHAGPYQISPKFILKPANEPHLTATLTQSCDKTRRTRFAQDATTHLSRNDSECDGGSAYSFFTCKTDGDAVEKG